MLQNFLQKSPFVRVLVPYMAGIVCSYVSGLSAAWYLIPITAVLLIVTIVMGSRGGFIRNILTGIAFSAFFFMAGLARYGQYAQVPQFPEADFYMATVLEEPEARPRSFRAEILLTGAGTQDSIFTYKETLIAYFSLSDSGALPLPGSRIMFHRAPQEILQDGNPYGFDYNGYMQRKGIYRQVWLPEGGWMDTGAAGHGGLKVYAEKARSHLLQIYQESGLQGDELAVLSALTLGYRRSLDPEVRQTFANAGAMHVLAVSGLHVGIIFMAFRILFSFLKKHLAGRIFYLFGALVLLWGYAFITGLSPSVQRAALMFSLIQFADILRRPAQIYNTLASSAFLLLLIKPVLLFEVGFQLSYSAVLGIVYFQPKLASMITLHHSAGKYLWDLFTVSVAAQIGTFAVSSFYFNQFPVYFWVTNFVVIPGALLLIILAVSLMLFSWMPAVLTILAFTAGKLVEYLLQFLRAVETLPGSVYSGFHFDGFSLWIVLVTLLFLVLFIESKRKLYFGGMIILSVMFLLNSAIMKYVQNTRHEVIVYQHHEPIVHVIYGRMNYVLTSPGMEDDMQNFRPAGNVAMAYRLDPPMVLSFGTRFQNRHLLLQDHFLFVGSKVIALPGVEWLHFTDMKPDFLIDFSNLQNRGMLPEGVGLVIYRNRNSIGGRPAHVLLTDGALRLSI